MAEHQRHGGENLRRRRAAGDVPGLGGVEGAGFFQREGDAGLDQEAGLFGHVAMAAQYEGEIRLQRRAHLTIIGVNRAAGAFGQRRGAARIGIADADDGGVAHFQHGIGVERRVPVRNANQNDAHVGFPPFWGARVSAPQGRSKGVVSSAMPALAKKSGPSSETGLPRQGRFVNGRPSLSTATPAFSPQPRPMAV